MLSTNFWKTLKTFLQHPWNFLKTPWKPYLNSSNTSFNHPKNKNFYEIPLKLPQSSLKTPLRDSRNFLETHFLSMKLAWNILDNSLKPPLDFLETPFKLFRLRKNWSCHSLRPYHTRTQWVTTSLLELLIAAKKSVWKLGTIAKVIF